MSKLLQGFGVIGTVAAATFFSGFAALIGAQVGGLQEGGWNFQFLPPLFYGWLGGFVLSLIGLGITGASEATYARRFTFAFVGPILITFCISVAVYSVTRPADLKSTLAKMKTHPETLRVLIAKAHVSPLSQTDRATLWHMVWVKNSIPVEEVSFLLDYFSQDGSALGGIMTCQTVTPEQLRSLYERHKINTQRSILAC